LTTWAGLSRYTNYTGKDAKEHVVFESSLVSFSYSFGSGGDNSSSVDLTVNDAAINYGPWSNNHRVVLQQFFFPSSYRNSTEVDVPASTQAYRISIKFAGNNSIKIPFSDGRLASTRPYWLCVHFEPDSFMNLFIPLYAGRDMTLDLGLRKFALSSSVNGSSFLGADLLSLNSVFEVPLVWNDPRTWIWYASWFLTFRDFKVSEDCQFWPLRKHFDDFALLSTDWSRYGAPSLALHFSVIHKCSFQFSGNVYLNCNRGNIIESPNDLGNTGLII
jgi:hypothetical protein